MGLGPSYQPNYPLCINTTVTFIYKGREITELNPWWHQTSLPCNGNELCSWYWACQGCFDRIPEEHRNKFKYIENYTVRGM